jgi:kynurenine formamidase
MNVDTTMPLWAILITFLTGVTPIVLTLVKMYFLLIAHEEKFKAMEKIHIQKFEELKTQIVKMESTQDSTRQRDQEQARSFKDFQVDTVKQLVRIETLLTLMIDNKLK